ncbi:MAG: SIMPL domain-containing protein [Methanospirillum sp.]
MRYTAAVLAALFCICGAVVVVTALTPTPTVDTTTADHLIRTSAVGEVVSSPDRAEIQIGVQTENADVQVAQSQNAVRMTNVTNAMKALGIPDDHLTTTGYTVTPVYDTNPTPIPLAIGQRKPTTYLVSNTLLVRVDDVAQVGKVIDAALQSDANQVNSIAFLFSEQKGATLRAQALAQAVNRTRTDAGTVASALGVRLLDAREVQVDSGATPIVYDSSGTASGAVAPTTPIQPGTLKVTASVQVAWAYA